MNNIKQKTEKLLYLFSPRKNQVMHRSIFNQEAKSKVKKRFNLKNTKSLVSIALVTLMLTAIFVGTANASGTTEEWKIYVDTENNFSISYPNDWEVPPFYVGGAFSAAALEENEPVAIVTVSSPITGVLFGLSTRDFFESIVRPEEAPEGYKRISVEEMEINGIPAIRHIYTTPEDNKTIKHMEFWLKKDTVAFVIMCSSPVEHFEKYAKTFGQIAATFKIIGVPSETPAPPLTPTPSTPGFEAVFAITAVFSIVYTTLRLKRD